MSESDLPGSGRKPPGSSGAGSSGSGSSGSGLSGPGGDGDPAMIDLPLRHGPSEPPELDHDDQPTGMPPVAQSARARSGRRRTAWIWLLPVVVVGILLWWLFWPAPARIVTSESALVFDTTRVGLEGVPRQITLSNAGERTLRLETIEPVGEAAADFRATVEACLAAPLAPGAGCVLEVSYVPTAAGDRRADLEIRGRAGNSPFVLPLSGSAVAPRVGLAPESVNFGAVQVGQQRARLTLTISNIGSTTLELGRVRFEGPQADEFDREQRCPKTKLEPGESCSFDIRFAPTAAGDRVGELLIVSDAPDQPTRLPLRGRGVWEGPPLDAEPASLDLGEQRVGRRSEVESIRFVNRTSGSVDVESIELMPEESPFAIVSNGCAGRALISGETCAVSVAVAPEEEGALRAQLNVGFMAAGTLQVPLAATGVAPRIEVQTTRLEFGQLRVGFESGARSADLVNTGSATVSVTGSRLAGEHADDFVVKSDCVGTEMSPGERCSLEVSFRPRVAGGRRAGLEITPSDELEPLIVDLAGIGTVAGLAVAPASLGWTSIQLGKADDRRLTLSNTGSARLSISGLRIVGDAASDFAVRRIACQLDAGLAPAETCGVTVRFAPSAEGARVAGIEISHNGPESPFQVSLSGAGEPQRPLFRASARDFGFGTVAVGSRSDIATLTISNLGSAWLPLRGIALRGEHAVDYELVAGTCDGVTSLAPGGSCTVGVRFVPTAAGRRSGTLELRHGAAGSPALITLAGVGG